MNLKQSMTRKYSLTGLILVLTALHPISQAKAGTPVNNPITTGACHIINGKSPAKTLDETLAQSDFIGVFEAGAATRETHIFLGQTVTAPHYDVPLKLRKPLTRQVPLRINVISQSDTIANPPHEDTYLAEINQEIVKGTHLEGGQSHPIQDEQGLCHLTTHFVTGQEYLVFHGANSTITYAPITDRTTDPLFFATFQKVREIQRRQRAHQRAQEQ